MMFGLEHKTWLLIGGIALLGVSMFVVNRFDLHRKGMLAPLTTSGASKLPTVLALACGIAGGVLVYYGLRAA